MKNIIKKYKILFSNITITLRMFANKPIFCSETGKTYGEDASHVDVLRISLDMANDNQ